MVGDAVTNSADSPITIKEVSLVEPHALTLQAAYLAPAELAIGSRSEFPPIFDDEDRLMDPEIEDNWSARVEAIGATVPPGESRWLAVGLAPSTREDATAKAIRLTYAATGNSYFAETTTEIRIAVGKERCS